MKVSKIFCAFNNKFDTSFLYIFLIILINSIFLIFYEGAIITSGDSITYINAWDSYRKGIIDMWRTPVYPIIIGSSKLLFGDNFAIAIVVFQHIIFLLSVYLLYKLLILYFNDKRIIITIILFYGIFPGISGWNNVIMTESLATSGMVLLLFVSRRLYERQDISIFIMFGVLLFLLIFMRPVFVYCIPVFLLFFLLIVLKKNRIVGSIGLLCIILLSLCYFGYTSLYKKTYGIYSSSCVGIYNQLYIARENALLYPEEVQSLTFKRELVSNYERYGKLINHRDSVYSRIIPLFNSCDLQTLDKEIKISMLNHSSEWLKACWIRFYRSLRDPFFSAPQKGYLATIIDVCNTSYSIIYLFVFIYLFYLFIVIKKKGVAPYFSLLLLFLLVSNVIVILLGAQDDYYRLILPSYPIILLMIVQFLSSIDFNLKDSVID